MKILPILLLTAVLSTTFATANTARAAEDKLTEPLPAAALDSAFEQLKELFPALYLQDADSDTDAENPSIEQPTLSDEISEFLTEWFDDLLKTADRLEVTTGRIEQYYPELAATFIPACEEYITNIMKLRMEAYQLGVLDRKNIYPGNAALDSLQAELKQADDALLPFEEIADASSRTRRAKIQHVFYYLTEYVEDSHTLLDYYELGRYLGLPAEEAGPNLPLLAQLVCEQAISEAEAVDDPYLTKRNKYNAYFGDSGSPWCAYFVVYNAIKAGVPDSVIPHTNNRKEGYICVGGCAALRNYMLKYSNATWHDFDSDYTPMPGDIIYYGSNTSIGSIRHVGLVLGTEGDYQASLAAGESVQIRTVEGNTSWEEHTSNCIRIKVRKAAGSNGRVGSGFYVLGYLTPDYEGAASSAD